MSITRQVISRFLAALFFVIPARLYLSGARGIPGPFPRFQQFAQTFAAAVTVIFVRMTENVCGR